MTPRPESGRVQYAASPGSLTLRLLAFVALAIGLSLVLGSVLVLGSIRQHFVELDAGELRAVTGAIARTIDRAERAGTPLGDALPAAISGHHGVYYQVEDAGGRLLYRAPGPEVFAGTARFPAAAGVGEMPLEWESAGANYRGAVVGLPGREGSYRVAVAIDMGAHVDFLGNFRRSLWLIMLGTGGFTLLATWFGIHQGYLPLRKLSESMSGIRASRLDVRLDPDSLPKELRELAVSFNQMAGRLEEGFERLSHFSADIAHELRTPLTNLITQTQVGLSRGRSLEEYRELLYSNLEEQERLAKMVSDMLWLAKSDNDLIKPVLTPLDLAREIRALFGLFEALAAEQQVELVLEGGAPTVRGDRALLQRALYNLLSNAIRHTPAGQCVRLRLAASQEEGLSIAVANPGETVPPEHLPRLFDRFYRVDPSRHRQSEGTGLGLAITRSIIEAHGGRLEVASRDGITTFTATLPGQLLS